MSKRKLERFAEMETFSNVIQPGFEEVFRKDHRLKGRWHQEIFGNDHPIILELGCGKGEYTVGMARMFPGLNFLGVDIKGSRIWKGAKTALKENLRNAVFLRTRIEQVTSFFGQDEIDEIWLTFPDPQPKKSRKRLTSTGFLLLYAAFLKPQGMIHLKTDSSELYDYTLSVIHHNRFELKDATADLYNVEISDEKLRISTFYETQFLGEGKPICYLCFSLNNAGLIGEPEDE